jgi:tripartite-type tricarboxylate transporter receptor subunit TctC
MAVPAATPRDIISKLHAEAARSIAAPELRQRMSAEGAEFVGDTPEQFTAFFKSELSKWGKAVKASGAKVD